MNIDIDKFQKTYYEKVKPLEKEIKYQKVNVYIQILIILLVSLLMTIYFTVNIDPYLIDNDNFKVYSVIVVFTSFIIIWIVKHFTYKVKCSIFPELFKSIDTNLIYNANVMPPKEEFIDSDLYDTTRCSYNSEDSLFAKMGNKDIKIFELLVKRQNSKSETKIFSGLFAHIILTKSVKYNIKIRKNTTKDYGILKNIFVNENKVNLENIEFEKNYDVYCSDQIYARKILTLSFMEKLLEATNKIDNLIQISFKNNNIYIAINDSMLIDDKALFFKNIEMITVLKTLENVTKIIDTINYLNLSEEIV